MGAITPDAYDIHLDDKYGQLTLIDVAAEAARHEPWFNVIEIEGAETVRLRPQPASRRPATDAREVPGTVVDGCLAPDLPPDRQGSTSSISRPSCQPRPPTSRS